MVFFYDCTVGRKWFCGTVIKMLYSNMIYTVQHHSNEFIQTKLHLKNIAPWFLKCYFTFDKFCSIVFLQQLLSWCCMHGRLWLPVATATIKIPLDFQCRLHTNSVETISSLIDFVAAIGQKKLNSILSFPPTLSKDGKTNLKTTPL